MIFSQKLVDRYDELKQRVPDCILLMQVGAFMQVMNEDARAVSQVTGLKLRMAGEVDAPLVLEKIIEANNARDDRVAHLLELRQELEIFKLLARLCHESGGFASTRSYLYVAECITNIARQNEGWLKKTQGKGRQRQKSGEEKQTRLGI